MSDDYVGQIVLEINGTDYEVTSVEPNLKTGRKVVKTMNRLGRATGTAKGIEEHELKISVVIPKSGEPDWRALVDAKITTYSQDGGGKRETWTGCSLLEMGSKYQVEGEATRDLTVSALNYYQE
ncbi:phage tail protein [Pseudomonas chlororaphis]|uniref:phage tail protein n=1 Tax=Pseudomonas chlororaphis TaxID=587753 RepID=UPI000F581604|nr:phage tail protein [Pseudomonas chlororaphis]AZC67367.1 Transaldolase [Pseudomonas chlororaphis subsp. piscium]MBP5056341.1 phage tail protein [Pseudomonas chlororaphis]MBP5143101.1 phage tail protein [Pseudomonas chlororaphis]QTT98502.1 phage tail protein [Pseudomonas chlororaphis]